MSKNPIFQMIPSFFSLLCPVRAVALAVIACAAVFPSSPVAAAERPNFLVIVADDCTYRDLELHGGQAKTPHINRLADEGMNFTRCFQAAPMCSPTRHNLYSGLYPVKSGGYPNHAVAEEGVRSVAHYLPEAGYRVGLAGKSHVGPESVYPFESVPGFDRSCTRSPTRPHTLEGVTEFMGRDAGKPFCLFVALVEPHSPWVMGDASAYPPEELELPPVFADTPETREHYARYLAEITYMDSQVGDVLGALEASGRADDTLVLFLSEQGSGFPFAKWTCYDAGLQSAAVIRWPGVVAPGSETDAMIEYVDVLPTFLEVAGAAIPETLDGRSFLPVLRGETDEHKRHVFGIQTTRGVNNGAEHYGVRSARSGDYLYIRNLTPDVVFSCVANKGEPWDSWVRAAEGGDEHATRLVHDYRHRPAEELYDVRADPWNRTNLIDEPGREKVRLGLRAELDAWMNAQGDEGAATEMRALEHMKARRTGKSKTKTKSRGQR